MGYSYRSGTRTGKEAQSNVNLRASSSVTERRQHKPEVGWFDSLLARRFPGREPRRPAGSPFPAGRRTEGFRPDSARGFRHELIGPEDCRYLERWVLNVGPFAVRLHHFFRSDEEHLHDHPWWFAGVCLRGTYLDVSDSRTRRVRPGTFYFRRALHRHRVVTDGCWTLIVSGAKSRDWGFWVNGTWLRQRRYFREHGSHACD